MGSATPSLNKSLLKSKYFTLMDSHPTSCFKAPSPITRCPTESSPRRPHHLLFDYAPPHTLPIIILLIRSRRTSGRASSRPGQAGAVTKRRPGRGASSSVAKRLTSERGQGTLRTRVCVCVSDAGWPPPCRPPNETALLSSNGSWTAGPPKREPLGADSHCLHTIEREER